MRRYLALLLIPLLLLLAGCSGSDSSSSSSSASGPLDSMKVTSDEDKKVPGLDFAKPLVSQDAAAKVIKEGDGDTVKAGQSVSYVGAVINGADGAVQNETFTTNKLESLLLSDSVKQQNEVLYNALVNAKVGSYIAFATPAQTPTAEPSASASSSGSASASASASPTASNVIVLKLQSVKDVPTRAQGTAVAPKAGLPTVKLADDGAPTVTVPKTKAPTKLVAQDLITGKGQKVKATDNVTVQYTGVKWSDGSVFDSSWKNGSPVSFPLSGVVKGWTQGLTGKTVGSQVLLVVPPSLGYGSDSTSELKNETLVFVVDILDVAS
ncbi:peptidylprolyl isomerase [Tersicoccus solisilvae]|uniref:peptidylprolyl isomerase n=1 Tax=Tersicoccus solisilvae TaxID=1882339 RepID=A0ABQ1NUJ4_9MICC|nr:FKBP-type peptidyl-prolyl cis-trans isomerase [Tersicoccus solisilvae]GGC83662.1 peptidylprolyl isomerase [Tersicoccus solisilvae]